ncbi:DNA double-strand break repair nuclease NurA [Candidatus Woesearchaeota archaeon]|nr:DNA double-strand break repair nuclease NurA [Candidatus Woesearchaeota archaeon]
MQHIFDEIVSLVKNNIYETNDKCVKFSDPAYKAFDLDIKNFHEIKKIHSKNKIAFIDGGSSEIIKSSNFSLSLIRVYYTIYRENKRIASKKQDFYAFASAKDINNELYYDVEVINNQNNITPNNEDLFLSSMDETIKQGIARVSISNMSNLIRRFSELKTALDIMDLLDSRDIIILDGSLQCTFTNEKKYFDELYKKAIEKNIIICGLSKTTTLMTDKGNSIASALNKFNFKGRWLYSPVAEIKTSSHKAEMSFVKLHEKSGHIFRFEIYKEQKQCLRDVISMIAENCKDPVFIGYPYALIEADRNARISDKEKGMMLMFFSAKFGKDWEKIKESLSNIDAHEILDSIG